MEAFSSVLGRIREDEFYDKDLIPAKLSLWQEIELC